MVLSRLLVPSPAQSVDHQSTYVLTLNSHLVKIIELLGKIVQGQVNSPLKTHIPSDKEQWYTVKEAAPLLGMGKSTLRKKIADGTIPEQYYTRRHRTRKGNIRSISEGTGKKIPGRRVGRIYFTMAQIEAIRKLLSR